MRGNWARAAAELEAQMTFVGVLPEASRDSGSHGCTYFAIPAGQELAAGRDLLACLADGCEVCLRNDLDEGGEGCTSFRRWQSGLMTMVGGHGWQSGWTLTDEASIVAAVVELASFNRGGHWSRQGSITRGKDQVQPVASTGWGR
jgi:hypothetical protein